MNNFYLLDTHILLWWLSNDRKLSKKMRALIADPNNYILISSASVWEIIIKKSLNKLKVPDNLKEILETSDIKVLPITADHVLEIEHLPYIHHDPFDRVIVAQCIVEDITIVTTDKIIHKYKISCF